MLSGTSAMHMFVPALPQAGQVLGASIAAMQSTVTVYVIGLACGQLIYGPLSDGLGRRPVLLAGLAVYTVGGLWALLAPDVESLIVARLFQALGGAAGFAIARVITRDQARPEEAARDLALLNLTSIVGPTLAPIIGSTLAVTLGWRSILMLLVLLGCTSLLLTWRLLPETGRPSGQIRFGTMLRDFKKLLVSPIYMGFAIGGSCATTSSYAYLVTLPFLISMRLGRPLYEVGWYLGLFMTGTAMGIFVTRSLTRRFSVSALLMAGNLIALVSALSLLLVTLFGTLTVVNVVGLMFAYSVGAGTSSPTALAKSLNVDASIVGSAGGLYGFLQTAIGALCTFLAGFGDDPALTAAIVVASATVLGQAAVTIALRAESRQRRAKRYSVTR